MSGVLSTWSLPDLITAVRLIKWLCFLSLGADPQWAGHHQCQRNCRPTTWARKRDPLRWVMGKSEYEYMLIFKAMCNQNKHASSVLFFHFLSCPVLIPPCVLSCPHWLDDLSSLSWLNCSTVSLCMSFQILRARYSLLLSWIWLQTPLFDSVCRTWCSNWCLVTEATTAVTMCITLMRGRTSFTTLPQ